MKMPTDTMAAAYMEAACFTDCGDTDQPPSDAEFSEEAKREAWSLCNRFFLGAGNLLGGQYERAGHDLWLTRNGHGVGFWDRPEVWGEENAKILTYCAKVLGPVGLYQAEDGLLYWE